MATDPQAWAGSMVVPATLISQASFKGNPKVQAARSLGEMQVLAEGCAAAPPRSEGLGKEQAPPDHPQRQNGGQTTNRDVPALQAARQR